MVLLLTGFLPVKLSGQEPPSYLPDRLKSKFATYRKKSDHRAFALGRNGAWAFEFNHPTINKAREKALATCRDHGADCTIIAENNRLIVRDNPFPSSGSSDHRESDEEGFSYVNILILIAIGLLTYVFFSRYNLRYPSPQNP